MSRAAVTARYGELLRDHSAAELAALLAREEARLSSLRDAVEEYALWEPGRRGHAAAHRRLLNIARGVAVAA